MENIFPLANILFLMFNFLLLNFFFVIFVGAAIHPGTSKSLISYACCRKIIFLQNLSVANLVWYRLTLDILSTDQVSKLLMISP